MSTIPRTSTRRTTAQLPKTYRYLKKTNQLERHLDGCLKDYEEAVDKYKEMGLDVRQAEAMAYEDHLSPPSEAEERAEQRQVEQWQNEADQRFAENLRWGRWNRTKGTRGALGNGQILTRLADGTVLRTQANFRIDPEERDLTLFSNSMPLLSYESRRVACTSQSNSTALIDGPRLDRTPDQRNPLVLGPPLPRKGPSPILCDLSMVLLPSLSAREIHISSGLPRCPAFRQPSLARPAPKTSGKSLHC